jgi:hypothetical protein
LARILDRLPQAENRGPLLLEGLALVLMRDVERDKLPVELRDLVLPLLKGCSHHLLLELTQRLLPRRALRLESSPGLDESGPLLLKLAFRLLACGSLLPELLLRRDDRGGLVGQAGPQLLGLFGPLLGLTLLGPCSLEGYAVLLSWARTEATSTSHSAARPRQIFPRPPQRLVLFHERCAHPLDNGGPLRRLSLQPQ